MIDRSGRRIDREKKKRKKKRSCKQEAKTRCANIKDESTRKRCNELRGGGEGRGEIDVERSANAEACQKSGQ